MNIFAPTHTRRPDPALFHRRHDALDRRLGEVVSADPAAYAEASVVLLGCPQDEGVRRNGGRPGAALAPDAIRRCLYKLTDNGLQNLPIFDLGDTVVGPTLEATHERHQAVMAQLLRDGKRVVVLGGGNDVAYPDCAALAQVLGLVLAFNIDAHLDVRADAVPHSGTPYRQLLQAGHLQPAAFYELGHQPWSVAAEHLRYLRELGAQVYSLPAWRAAGLSDLVVGALSYNDADAVFWGFDVDVVRAADAPGVSAPNALGLAGEEFCALAALAGAEQRTRLVEFSELNPLFDQDERTARLVAVAVYHYLVAVAGLYGNEPE